MLTTKTNGNSSGYRWQVARKQDGERFEMAQHQKQGCDNRGLRLDVEVVGEFLHGATLVGLGSRRRRAGRDKKQGSTVSWPYLAVSDMQPAILAAARRASRALDAFPRPSKENFYMRNVMGRIWRVWGGIYGRPLRPPGEGKTRHSHSVFASRNWVNESKSGHSRNNSAWLGWDGAGIGEQSLLAPHSLLCSLHPPHPGASLLLVVTDSSSLRATSTCCCSNRSLLPCLFLVPRSVAPLRLPQSFFPNSSVPISSLAVAVLRRHAILSKHFSLHDLLSPAHTRSALVSTRWPIPSPKSPFVP